jgi:hypothetical protein
MSKHERKDNAASTRREDSKGSGGDGDGDGDSVSTVFYSDQGESGAAASASEGEGEAKTKAGVMNGSAVPTRVNGHRHGHEKRKSGSEISHSTVSTVVGGPSGQQQRTQEQQQSQAESSQTPPRRRKSVRVSLKPTFSPSPPAIEYDYEEEHQRYAAWERKDERSEKDHSPSRLHPPPPPHAAVVAPKPVHAAPAQHRLVVDRDVGDMWEDSGEDEDEQYATAKSLLTRAAKKDKDLMLKIARGRA